MPRLETIRTQSQHQDVTYLLTSLTDEVHDLAKYPWATKVLKGICIVLLKELAKTPGAYWRLIGVREGMKIFSQYKRPSVPKCPPSGNLQIKVRTRP